MKQKKLKTVLSCLLSACLPLSMMGASSAYAITPDEEPPAPTGVNTPESFVLPDIVSAAEAEENGYIGRDYTAEHDLSTFVFKNEDGTGTMRVYSHPVKYYDERGKVRDISLDLAKDADGKIVTAKNNIKTAFPEVLSEGIALSHEDIDLLMVPITDNANAVAEFDEKARTVSYRIDDRTAYVYGLTYTGFKEDIVVSEYTGQTDYRFTLYTNGLALKEDDGVFMLTDKEGEPTAYLSDIVVYTADGGNNTVGAMNCEAVVENEQYALTVHLDEDYLRDEATVYPIRIDPSITVTGFTSIFAKCLCNDNLYSTMNLYVGRKDGKKYRMFLGFPLLGSSMSVFSSSLNISEATLDLYNDASNSSTQNITVYCSQFNKSWVDSGDTWSSLNQNGYAESSGIYTILDEQTITGGSGYSKYTFDVTIAAKRWKDQYGVNVTVGDTFTPTEGLVFNTVATIENGSSTRYKTFVSPPILFNEYGPSLKIKFTYSVQHNMFFSKYEPSKLNFVSTVPESDVTIGAMRRMNCYGYAFGNILSTANSNSSTTQYFQTPGEFASNSNISNVIPNYQMANSNNPTTMMNYIVNNMNLDASNMGYTITEYTPSASNGYEVDQYGTSSRLIAVVTSENDFHFYMQHSDGTWSHKTGKEQIRNVSLSSGESNIGSDSVILTNDNIYSRAAKRNYEGGVLKFFVISRGAIWDYPHTNSCFAENHTGQLWPNCGHTNLLAKTTPYMECAGNHCETAAYLGGSSNIYRLGRLDYHYDYDVFTFYVNDTNTHTFTISWAGGPASAADVCYVCTVYTTNGTFVASNSDEGTVSLSVALNPGTLYHLEISDEENNCSLYQISFV